MSLSIQINKIRVSVCDLGVIAESSSLLRLFVRKRKMLRFLFADLFSCLFKLALPIRFQSVIHRRVQKFLYKSYPVLKQNLLFICLLVYLYTTVALCQCVSICLPACLLGYFICISTCLYFCLSEKLSASLFPCVLFMWLSLRSFTCRFKIIFRTTEPALTGVLHVYIEHTFEFWQSLKTSREL